MPVAIADIACFSEVDGFYSIRKELQNYHKTHDLLMGNDTVNKRAHSINRIEVLI